jgi:hypothetical protein
MVQSSARYWNGGYWRGGLRGGGGRFNIARIALKWMKTEENQERAEGAANNPRDHEYGQANPQQSQGAQGESRAIR